MFNWYRKWRLKQLLKLQSELAAENEANKPQLQRVMSEESDKFRDSKEPWVTIIGDTISEEGIQLALDWNDAFVKYLKTQGVTGADDTQVVQHWLAMISRQAADKLSENYEQIENKVNEYQ
ncbi:hypothetical protein LCGC14_2005790 [marine sediment metagenome]|uniref:Uncharacterized protein n=1 Tax=marine sediment metagenome TaxID=412755 RepID=A0A0F9F1X5_9ZZZZ